MLRQGGQENPAEAPNETGITNHPNDLTLADVITASPLEKGNSTERAAYILAEFNKHINPDESCFTTSWLRGNLIDPNKFILGHRNRKPELIGPQENRYVARVLNLSPTINNRIIDTFPQDQPFFGKYGAYVLNVPIGKIARAMSGNIPKLYGPGPHVIHDPVFKFNPDNGYINQTEMYIKNGNIHILRIPRGMLAKVMIGTRPLILEPREQPYVFDDPLFKFDLQNDLVDQTSPYIKHGTINILRVPVGKVAKVWHGTEPELLEYRQEPYVFNDPLFKFDANSGYVSKATPYIKHGTIHVLRIPAGKVAGIWLGNKPQLLNSQAEPYEFNDPLFRFVAYNNDDGFCSENDPYIHNGTIHVLRVPAGKIATIWEGTEPKFLESQPEPYKFNSAVFKLDTKNGRELFYDATDPLIIHGYKKRLMVHTGQVAVTWDNGKLKIIPPRDDAKPTIIESPNHQVSNEFLSTCRMNLEFPSEATRAKRLKENKNASDVELAYELFTTKDSLKVGVKLYLAITITDPELALSKLSSLNGILEHVESCATVDMGMAIQQCTSQEFLSSTQTKPTHHEDGIDLNDKKGNISLSIQDQVRKKLSKDLEEIGIELNRMNFESPKIIDPDIAKKMSEQSLAAADANTKEALLEKNFRIAKRNAEQEASTRQITAEQEARTKKIAQDQQNEALISKARAAKEAAQLEADATIIRAEAEKRAIELRGQPLQDNSQLYNIELARLQMDALSKARMVTPQMASILTSGLFATPAALVEEHKKAGGLAEPTPVIQLTTPKLSRSSG